MEFEGPDDPNVDSAVVKYTDKTMDELLDIQFKNDNFYSIYTTPDNIPFVGVTFEV